MPTDSELPRITIVTPVMNQAEYLEDTIRSVTDQGYPNLQYIVIDGGSTDGTLDVIRRNEGRIDSWISEPDRGQSDAINKGIAQATGDYWGWVNGDDILLPGSLHTAGCMLAAEPDLTVLFGTGDLLELDRTLIKHTRYAPYYQHYFRDGSPFLQPASFFHTETTRRVGCIDVTLRYAMDWDLFLKLDRAGPVKAVPDRFAAMRIHEGQITQEPGWARYRELARIGRRYYGLLDRNNISYCLRRCTALVPGRRPRAVAHSLMDRFIFSLFPRQALLVRNWPTER